jgi:dihydroorotase
MRTLLYGGTLVNEGTTRRASIIIEDGTIAAILPAGQHPDASFDETVDASGCFVLPGIIDDHVHFREPGLTEKADIDTESRAAAAGGVTSYFDMPNCVPQTTTLEAFAEKERLAAAKSHVNYAFFFGATNDNADLFAQLPADRIPGIKLFMGSSTGNMLVDRDASLRRIFSAVAPLPLMAHCEDTDIINRNMAEAKGAWGDDPPVTLHPMIRSEEACLASTRKAVELAKEYGTRLHVAHLSTAEELELFTVGCDSVATNNITAEACVGHLVFTMLDHERLGARIKVNPAIKSPVDQFMLRQALSDGRIATVATDHAPHLLSQKEGGCARAASGMPMVQFALVAMLELVDAGVLTMARLVELMAHNPARLFGVCQRGFLRPGYRADLVVVRPHSPWMVTADAVLSKCGWSPVEGHTYQWRVERTLCNGHTVYADGHVDSAYVGEPLLFNHDYDPHV